MLSQISLNYQIDKLDYLSVQLEHVFELWQIEFNNIENINESDKKLLVLLNELNNLLFIEQQTLIKWHRSIELAQNYFQLLSNMDGQLVMLSKQLEFPSITVEIIPNNITSNVENILQRVFENKFSVKPKHIYYVLYGVLAFLIIVFVSSLLALRRKIIRSTQLIGNKRLDGDSDMFDYQLNERHTVESLQLKQELMNEQTSLWHELLFNYAQIAIFDFTDHKSPKNKWAKQLLQTNEVMNKSWRHAVSKHNAYIIIKAAKNAKVKKEITEIQFEAINGQCYLLILLFESNSFKGIISKPINLQAMHDEIVRLNKTIDKFKHDNRSILANKSEQLSKMLTRTMLQSQSASLGTRETSTQLYRQLSRILDWSNQLFITSTVLENTIKINDVDLKDELIALGSNLAQEAKLQRNRLILKLDSQLASHGKVNVNLFQQLLLGITRLCLQDLFKSTLVINVKGGAVNSEQQTIGFSFEIYNQKPESTTPEAVSLLINSLNDSEKKLTEHQLFISTLIKLLNGNNLQITDTEYGYKVYLDLLINLSKQSKIDSQIKYDLAEKSLLFLHCHSVLKNEYVSTIKKANGQCEVIGNIEKLITELEVKKLTIKKISVIIVSYEIQLIELEKLKTHINTLPSALQPKLLVLQAHCCNNLHHEGLYKDSNLVFDQKGLISSLQELIEFEVEDNQLFPFEEFISHSFHQTQVEVLIAVHHPLQHQQLSRLLDWMGLQVKFVCQAETMLQHWQSGQYLLLLSEFNLSPIIELKVGKSVRRGIFTFNNKELENFKNNKEEIAKNWQFKVLPSLLDIAELIQLFSPWLKEKKITSIQKNTERLNTTEVKESVNTLINALGALIKKEKPIALEENTAFDLARYAENQGSPELAVFMLDEYLNDIELLITKINTTFSMKDISQAIIENEQLLKTCQIIAADEMILLSQQLDKSLKERNLLLSNSIIKRMLNTNSLLTEFAKAI